MHRSTPIVVLAVAAVAVAVLGFTAARGDSLRPLPLQREAVPSPLLAVVNTDSGTKLERVAPSTLAPLRTTKLSGYSGGWVFSPDGKLLAIGVGGSYPATTTIRFANTSTLALLRKGVEVDGYLQAGLWPRPGVLYALTGDCCTVDMSLETVDTVAKKVVAKTKLPGELGAVARSAGGLVFLGSPANELGPVRLSVLGPDGRLRSTTLARVVGGTHVDRTSQDPIVTTRQPGLAVDPAGGVAYVIDAGGLVAQVRLRDLAVTYHRLAQSLLARLSAWVTPPAQAKGLDGPQLTAQWLGDGLVAVAGTRNSTTTTKDGGFAFSTSPAGLWIIDTRTWRRHSVDAHAEQALVTDGLLLARGGEWRSATNAADSYARGEGVVAYGPDGKQRWQMDAGKDVQLLAAWGSRALVQSYGTTTAQPVRLVDLDTHRVVRSFDPDSYPLPLVGPGS